MSKHKKNPSVLIANPVEGGSRYTSLKAAIEAKRSGRGEFLADGSFRYYGRGEIRRSSPIAEPAHLSSATVEMLRKLPVAGDPIKVLMNPTKRTRAHVGACAIAR